MTDDEDVTQPILTSELDLHTFVPNECADVVEEYVNAAHEAGMTRVRIIHGKGKGTARFWTCDLTEGYIQINASYRT